MFNDCYNRPTEYPPEPPLPLYVYSVGEKTLEAGEVSEMGILKNVFAELIWGVSGVGELTLYEENFTLNPGDLFWYLPGEAHRHRALSAHWRTRWIAFDGPLAAAFLLACRYPRRLSGGAAAPDRVFPALRGAVADADPRRVREISGILGQILTSLVNSEAVDSRVSGTVRQCMEYVTAHLDDRMLDVPVLAERFRVSPSTLARMFREKIGVPPGRFILDRRVQKAQVLLRGTQMPIARVAEKCGFADSTAFARFVRRNLGDSPLAYRRRDLDRTAR